MDAEDITEDDFKEYERVKRSGRTNMMRLGNVAKLSTLEEEQVATIIENYEDLKEKYGEAIEV